MADVNEIRHGHSVPYSDVVPVDLVTVALVVAVADLAIFEAGLWGTPVATVFGLILFLFAPGYVLLAALFPRSRRAEVERFSVLRRRATATWGLDGVERVALAFALSLALLPIIGLVVSVLAGGFTSQNVHLGVQVVVFGGALVGAARRMQLPPEDRFTVPLERWFERARGGVLEVPRPTAVVNLALAVSLVLAVAALGTALVVPQTAEAFSDFYLLAETGSGDLVTSGYPTEFVRGEGRPLVLGVENHEGEAVTYTIVVELQRVADGGQVVEETELTRFQETVAAGDQRLLERTITPDLVGDDLRLRFYLYEGAAPADADAETAYRYLHLWITVTDPGA